ncbi:MAG: ribonuclease III domain-containing protein [Bacteroidales bacterium]|nr:ribonuclease III domain-containing protein [Bacteroidales bacterium]
MICLFRRKRENEEFYSFFRNVLGFTPRRTETYQIAFIHRSRSRQTPHGYRVNNERLEYLGDAVLETIVSEYLYKKYPFQGEGFLTEMRSKIVSRANLNKLALKIGLTQLIEYNRQQQGAFKSISGDAFEALTGAIYLERGYKFTRKVMIDRVFNLYLDIDAIEHSDWNFKSKLLNWGQREHRKISYEIVRSFYQGKAGESRKSYECQVLLDDVPQKKAINFSIKAAEQLAAEMTYKDLKEQGIIKEEV